MAHMMGGRDFLGGIFFLGNPFWGKTFTVVRGSSQNRLIALGKKDKAMFSDAANV